MQCVFIINFNSLYKILDEIKENLSFKIIKFENAENFQNNLDLDIIDYLVISKTDHKLLVNNNISNKNFLVFNDLPLSLKKLIELINIRLIKLKFNQQSKTIIKGYELNLNSKFFSKGNLKLKLTEKEIEIILYLNDKKIKHNVADLQKNIWGYSKDMETHTVETHIYRLRKKISDLFKDEKFILSHKNGYFIDQNSLI
jgi:DNA-binding winged helix-turn-helix (wHTH) protein